MVFLRSELELRDPNWVVPNQRSYRHRWSVWVGITARWTWGSLTSRRAASRRHGADFWACAFAICPGCTSHRTPSRRPAAMRPVPANLRACRCTSWARWTAVRLRARFLLPQRSDLAGSPGGSFKMYGGAVAGVLGLFHRSNGREVFLFFIAVAAKQTHHPAFACRS